MRGAAEAGHAGNLADPALGAGSGGSAGASGRGRWQCQCKDAGGTEGRTWGSKSSWMIPSPAAQRAGATHGTAMPGTALTGPAGSGGPPAVRGKEGCNAVAGTRGQCCHAVVPQSTATFSSDPFLASGV
mmetsp:Transcript_15635/g.35518  ORF Transcript_15635/g.35518 Transcript_15635/m.35518 type:complete len:129 (-) Transcript_15635:8-394(-)